MKRIKRKANDAGELMWYQRFGLFFFTRPRVTILLWILLASFGAVAYTTLLQREGYPNVSAPYSSVSGTYFVNDSAKVDEDVSRPVTEVVLGVDSVTAVTSQSSGNFFNLQIEFTEGTDPQEGSDQVEQAVTAADALPEGAQAQFDPMYVSSLTTDGDDALISVSSTAGDMDSQTLQDRAADVAEALDNGEAEIDAASRVRVVEAFQTGTDPATGKSVTSQESFDWIATTGDEGEVTFADSALVALQAKSDMDILDFDDSVQQSLIQLREDSDFDDVEITVAADTASDVRSQVNSLQENMLTGLMAVVLISFLLISLRASLITALAMVTVLAITVGCMYALGLTLNVITLFALILCLGLIVDDAIIVTEAIDKARRLGTKPRQAVATALSKIALASVAGTCTTILGFAPLLFISGVLGEFIRAIPIVLIISLAMSLLVSMTLIPFLSRYLLLRGLVKAPRSPVAKAEVWVAHGLSQLVRRAMRSRKQGVFIGLGAIGISLGMLIAGLYYAGKLQFNIFPPSKDSDALAVSLTFQDATFDEALGITEEANEVIADELGENAVRVSYQGSGNAQSATATVDLIPIDEREETAPQLAEALESRLDAVDGLSAGVKAESVGTSESGFVMQIQTEDQDKATALTDAIKTFLQDHTLERSDGTTAAVTEVTVSSAQLIQRADNTRFMQIDGLFDADDTSTLAILVEDDIKNEFNAERLEEDFGLSADALNFDTGQEADNQESFQSILVAFPILLLAMYLLLVMQFRSFSQPFIIFLAIPFSLFGVTAGLYFTNNVFSFFTMLAAFALLGISVNNTILLTSYANQARKEGLGRIDAIATALEERFRPLLTTSLTAVVALVPLALSDPFWESLSVALIFGLLSSTFLVIVAFPYYYLGNELIRKRFNHWRVLAWLAVLLAVSVVLGLVASGYVSGVFIALYLLVTFIYLTVQAIRNRRARKLVSHA